MKCKDCPRPCRELLEGYCVECFRAYIVMGMLEYGRRWLMPDVNPETLLPYEYVLDKPLPPEEQ